MSDEEGMNTSSFALRALRPLPTALLSTSCVCPLPRSARTRGWAQGMWAGGQQRLPGMREPHWGCAGVL